MTDTGRPAARRGFGWHLGVLLGMRIATVGANAAFYVLAARELGIAVFGHFAALVGIATVLSVVADLGTSGVVTRDAAAPGDPPSLGAALHLRARGSGVTIGFAGLACGVLLGLGTTVGTALLPLVVVAWTWLITTQSLLGGLLIGRGRTWVGAAVPLVEKAVSIGVFLCFPILGAATRDTTVRMWGSVLVGIAVSAAVAAGFDRPLLRRAWSSTETTRHWKHSFGFFATAVGAQCQSLDVTLVSWLAGGTAAGLLAAPSRMTTPLGVLASSAAAMLLVQARHPRAGAGADHRLAIVTVSVGVLTFVCVSPLIFFPAATARLILGPAYVPGAPVFRLIAIAVCVAAVNQPLAAAAQAAFQQAKVGFAVAAGALVGIVVIVLSARSVGAVGGGWGMLATQFVVLGLLLRARFRHGPARVGTAAAAVAQAPRSGTSLLASDRESVPAATRKEAAPTSAASGLPGI